ncbi:DUF4230 domain-containing protein [Cyclobacterium xiamenense]|uniref:DUF4230 domain-containing protein n=1 Tax=Cyclobacterium xiamenense TaxID=1297121 RepID=UPI0012B7962A|nr:DUF4230 domain-containing protein [Cyclobacterium xiamenense]
MIRQVLNSARFVLEILLVVGLVALVYWWNPLNVFGGKPGIQSTANIVSEIREMGQLISAEYYGEVVASIDEAQMNLLEEPEIRAQAEITYEEIQLELENLRNFHALSSENRLALSSGTENLSRRERKKMLIDGVGYKNVLEKLYFLGDWDQTSQRVLFDEVMAFAHLHFREGNESTVDRLSERQLRQTLVSWYNDLDVDWWDANQFSTDYFANKLSSLSRSEARKKLAMIGRGTVKAGFDFKGLNESMYHYDEEMGELHFFGFAPQILNADINPWFIPEKGIPGFDILTYNGRVDFNDSKKVKRYAVQKLTVNARNAGIIQQAEQHGGETLRRLFSLLTGKEIKKVIFHHDQIIQLTQDITRDYYISYEEAVHFETAIQNELQTIDSLKNASEDRYNNRRLAENKENTLQQMIRTAQRYEFETEALPYHYYSTFWYRIASDSLVDRAEWLEIKSQSSSSFAPESRTVALWASEDSLLLPSQFGAGVVQLYRKDIPMGNFSASKLSVQAWQQLEKEARHFRNISFQGDSVAFESFLVDETLQDSLLRVPAPFKYSPETWESWVREDERIQVIQRADTLQQLPENPNMFWLVDSSEPGTVLQFSIPFTEITHPELFRADSLFADQQLVLEDWIVFRSAANFQEELTLPQPEQLLSSRQVDQLQSFLEQLYQAHRDYHSRDFLTQTGDWFSQKWKNKSGILEKFQ